MRATTGERESDIDLSQLEQLEERMKRFRIESSANSPDIVIEGDAYKGYAVNIPGCEGGTTSIGTGACCLPDGTCEVVNQGQCLIDGGTYQGNDTTCDPNPCPSTETGACCTDGVCADGVTHDDCIDGGGIYLGDGTTCSGVDCTCCPFFDPYTTITFSGVTSGCPDGDITFPTLTWTKVSVTDCDSMAIGEWTNNSPVCGCNFRAMSCPPPFFTATDTLKLDVSGFGCDPFIATNFMSARLTCDGQVYFVGSAGDDDPTTNCPTVCTTGAVEIGPYDLSAGPIDITVPGTDGPCSPPISFRFVLTIS